MSFAPPPDPPPDFTDPRSAADFVPAHWPAANGTDPPPWEEAERHERRCIEFLASYYRLNLLNHRLLALRASGAAGTDALLAVDTAMSEHEALEDRYTPVGFYGDPEMEGVFYRNVLFVRPAPPRVAAAADRPVLLSSFLTVPGLEEIPEEELRGEPVFTRWDDGKVDL